MLSKKCVLFVYQRKKTKVFSCENQYFIVDLQTVGQTQLKIEYDMKAKITLK